jgi:hypothetical protein
MKCNKDISFLVIVIRKLHFKKENQMWLDFGWVIELRNFTVPGYFFISYFLFITVIIFFLSKAIRFDRIRILPFLEKSL